MISSKQRRKKYYKEKCWKGGTFRKVIFWWKINIYFLIKKYLKKLIMLKQQKSDKPKIKYKKIPIELIVNILNTLTTDEKYLFKF